MKLPALLLIIWSVLTTPSLTALEISRETVEALDKATRTDQIVGLSVAVGIKGQPIWARGFGLADHRSKQPVTNDTRMRAGSISKVMTAALVARLLEKQAIDLDRPIRHYLPDFPKKRWPVTLAQLTSHSAGVRHYRGNEFWSNTYYPDVFSGLAIFRDDPLLFQPGSGVRYSSYGWNLVSAVLARAGQAPFLSQMQAEVFAPLAMTATAAEDSRQPLPHIAAFHTGGGSQLRHERPVDNSYKWAGGGFVSTATDLVKFGLAHTEPGYLQAQTLTRLLTMQRLDNGRDTGFGVGWVLGGQLARNMDSRGHGELADFARANPQLIHHNGGSAGAVATLVVDPERDIAVAILANHDDASRFIQPMALTLMREALLQLTP